MTRLVLFTLLVAAGLLVALAFVDRVLFWLYPPSRGWKFN